MIVNVENNDVPKVEVNWGILSNTTSVTDVPVEYEFKFPDYITISGSSPDVTTMINHSIEIKIDLNEGHGCVALVPYKI